MKILIDGRLYGLENAGLGRYINNLIEKLAELDKQNEYVLLLRRKYFTELKLPANWKKVLADFRHYSFQEQIWLPWLIYKERPDIVHFPHFNVPVFFRGKFIVTIHDLLMHQQKGMEATTLSSPVYFIKRLGYNLVFDFAVKKSRVILVPSRAIKDQLFQSYAISEDKVVVTYEGVDEKIQSVKAIKLAKPYFVYAGNAYPHKNLKRLIEAILLLNTNYNQRVILAIASARNIFTQRVEKLVHELGANEFVKMLGFVPDSELAALYKNSSGFAFPSLSEGFGLPGLEAMALGTVILVSDIPVFREVYGEHALYFDSLDSSSIAKSMQKVLDMTQNDRKKIIEAGQIFVKRYSWAKMAQETLEIYKNEGSTRLR